MIRRTFAWFAMATVLGGTAIAAETSAADPGRTGWYVGGGATYAFEAVTGAGASASVGDSPGFTVLGGYRLHRNVAAELDVDYLNDFGVDVAGREAAHLTAVATTLNGKGYLATGRVQPYGVVGVGGLYGVAWDLFRTADAAGFLARFGGGMDLYATDHVVLNAEASYDLPTGDLAALRFVPVTVGAQYRF